MYNPNYKLRTALLTKIARLRKPYGPSMRFKGELPRATYRRKRRPKPAPLLEIIESPQA